MEFGCKDSMDLQRNTLGDSNILGKPHMGKCKDIAGNNTGDMTESKSRSKVEVVVELVCLVLLLA